MADAGGEEEVPDALSPQVPIIEDVARRARASPASASPGYEADDVIGTLATRDPGPVDVVTGDRDLFQLVDDARDVRVLYTARGIGELEVVDEAGSRAKYGIPGRAYADFATLRGDPSDGLPGVAGHRREDRGGADHQVRRRWPALLAALDAGDRACPPGARTKLEAAATTSRSRRRSSRSPRRAAAGVRRQIPAGPARPRPAGRAAERWGLDSPLNRVLTPSSALHADA